ncbi:MAG: hypothetical protein QOI08_2021 [Actinomycetota bacterium]|jgi:hypothetical protein|nr:hypothetical protein [Actinomycetota bacterium]
MPAVDSVKAWVERRPKRAVLVTAISAVLIGALVGFGAGYKVEHDRVANDVARLKRTSSTTVAPGGGAAAAGTGRRDGRVTAASAGSLTIKSRQGRDVIITLGAGTNVDNIVKGTASDIVAGRHVLVVAPGAEVVVLRAGSTAGRTVKSVSKGSFAVAAKAGAKAATVKIGTRTIVEKLSPAKAADIKVGDQIIAFGPTGSAGPVKATDVIIVPASSKLAAA